MKLFFLVAMMLISSLCAKAFAQTGEIVSASTQSVQIGDEGIDRLVWERTPLNIGLRIGSERLVTLPMIAKVGVPQQLQGKLKIQIVNNTLYLTALNAFPKSRLQAHDPVSGAVILIDVFANKTYALNQPVEIVLQKNAVMRSATIGSTDQGEATSGNFGSANSSAARMAGASNDKGELDYVDLMRFAAKTFYAPARLMPAMDGIRRIAVDDAPIKGLMRLANVVAVPKGVWRSESLTVTALQVNNEGSTPVELDVRDIRCKCLAMVFQHGRLFARGNEADNTMLYVITDRPLADVLE